MELHPGRKKNLASCLRASFKPSGSQTWSMGCMFNTSELGSIQQTGLGERRVVGEGSSFECFSELFRFVKEDSEGI